MSGSLLAFCTRSAIAIRDCERPEDNHWDMRTVRMRMSGMLRAWCKLGLAAAAIVFVAAAPANAQSFPFDQEMLLEVKPLPGSRRVPMMEVHPDGKATVDMWCHSAVAQFTITGNEVK